MGWEDRPYYRDGSPSAANPLMWLLTGSVPLFTVWGIRVRAHASLLLVVVLVLVGLGFVLPWQDRVESMVILFGIVLVHEFGHCFAARRVGGEANEILMTPLGGLAMAMAPRRALPTFITVAAGPAVNVVICLVTGAALGLITGWIPLNPWGLGFYYRAARLPHSFTSVAFHLFWIYSVSYYLLLFNILPIFPLDGGQMLQAVLWPKFGYYRSMMFACITGMIGSVIMAMVGLATGPSLLLVFIAGSCFINCLQMRRMLLANGPWAFQEEEGVNYAASLAPDKPRKRKKKVSQWKLNRAKKLAQQERTEQAEIDAILAKVSAHGMQSLTWLEKRTLRKATERQRKRDLELSRGRS